MGGIGVEEPPTVTTQKLDRFLGRDRAARDNLLDALKRCHLRGRQKRLRNALDDQEEGSNDANR